MKNNTVFKAQLIGMLLLLVMHANFINASLKFNVQIPTSPNSPDFKHHAAHVVGDIMGACAAGAVTGIGIVIGLYLNKVVGESPDKNTEVMFKNMACLATIIPGIIGGGYIYYKTPQWTDTYVLGKDTTRTTRQNIISLLCRIFLMPFYPLNVVASEAVIHD